MRAVLTSAGVMSCFGATLPSASLRKDNFLQWFLTLFPADARRCNCNCNSQFVLKITPKVKVNSIKL